MTQHPTCNIVVQKEGEEEIVCGEPAAHIVWLVNPNNTSQIYAGVLVCHKHDHDLEEGKALIAVSEDRNEHLGVQYDMKHKEDRDDADDAKADGTITDESSGAT